MIEPAENLNRTSHHVRITCPHCHRSDLRIKRANLGCDVFCKRCGNRFRAVLPNDPGAIATTTQSGPAQIRPSAPAEPDQRRQTNGEGELQRIRAERDRLKAELREREADRLRFSERAFELAGLRADRDRLEAAVWEGVAREKQLQGRINEVEWRSGEAQDQAEEKLRVLEERLDAARLQLERDLTPLRAEADQLRHQAEVLVRDRDDALRQIAALGSDRDRLAVLLKQAETAGREAARHEAESHRLAQTIEQDRGQLAALVRRNEELVERTREWGTELDRLHQDQEDERREQGKNLEAVRHELESARAEATTASERAEAAGREAARHEAESHRLAQTIEQDRGQLAALVRRNEELAERTHELGIELDSLHRDHEDERREQGESLEGLRHDLENARVEANAASERATAAAATRAELEGRLAEFEGSLVAAHEQSQRLESELQVQRDRVAALTSESDPGRSLADADREADQLRHQVEILVRDRDDALRQIEALGSDRDRLAVLLERAEAAGRDAARHEAEAQRLARTIEQDRDQLAALVRRNEELAERTRELGTELDSLHRDHEDERREQGESLEALRHDLENARAEANAASELANAAAATRAELEGRLAEFEDRLVAAHQQSQRLESELQVQRDRVAALTSESDPGRSLADADREANQLRHQVEILVRDRDDALQQVEALGSDRDRLAVLLERAEAAGREAACHEAEAHRLARTIEQDRDQLAALVRRNEELAEQARELGTEIDRLQRDHEDERREQGKSLKVLRNDLENAQAEASAACDRALSAAAARAELEGRLAEFEDRLRAAHEQSQRLESEMQAQRDRLAALPSESDPGQTLADGDREADRLRLEQLTADFDQARAANERLRSLLNVFGLVDHLGSGAPLPPSV